MRYIITILLFVNLAFINLGAHAQGVPEIPQIPAFLPMANTVPMRETTPIDGEWMINTIGKRIRIQAGRAYALDPWVHMFVLKVNPMMVVISEISTTDGQNYVGKDLPLLGTWNATLDRDGMLNATVTTMVGPVKYALMPVRLDDQSAYDLAKSGEYSDYDEAPSDNWEEEEWDEDDWAESEYEEDEDYAEADW